MKKFVYVIVLLASLALTFSSCTEEVVKPKDADPSSSGTSTTKGF